MLRTTYKEEQQKKMKKLMYYNRNGKELGRTPSTPHVKFGLTRFVRQSQ